MEGLPISCRDCALVLCLAVRGKVKDECRSPAWQYSRAFRGQEGKGAETQVKLALMFWWDWRRKRSVVGGRPL